MLHLPNYGPYKCFNNLSAGIDFRRQRRLKTITAHQTEFVHLGQNSLFKAQRKVFPAPRKPSKTLLLTFEKQIVFNHVNSKHVDM